MTKEHQNPVERSNRLKLTWGLVCLIAPTASIVVALLLYAVANFFIGATAEPSVTNDELFGDTSMGSTIINVMLFLVGALATLTWLPGIIVGIILIAIRKPITHS